MVHLHFAESVRRLARDDLTVAPIAERLYCDEAAVMAALRMLGLPLPGEHDMAQERPCDAETMDRMPKKWQAPLRSRPPVSPADLCHPVLVRKPFTGPGWLFELKHDGFRAFVRTVPLELLTRKGRANVIQRPGVQVAQSVEEAGEALFALAIDQDFEGVVGKQMDAPYLAGAQRTWQKFENPTYSRPAARGVRDALTACRVASSSR